MYCSLVSWDATYLIAQFCLEVQWNKVFVDSCIYIRLKWSRYRPGVAQRLDTSIALLFHDRGTRRGWVVNSTPRPHFTHGKDPVPILQEAGWAPGPVWKGGKSRPHRDSIPDRPVCSQSLYRLSYPAHTHAYMYMYVVCIYIYEVPKLLEWGFWKMIGT
jgi:hypothetical protein